MMNGPHVDVVWTLIQTHARERMGLRCKTASRPRLTREYTVCERTKRYDRMGRGAAGRTDGQRQLESSNRV